MGKKVEARAGIEPADKGFADLYPQRGSAVESEDTRGEPANGATSGQVPLLKRSEERIRLGGSTVAPQERGIVFSAALIPLILRAEKTVTRRLCKPLAGATCVDHAYLRPDGQFVGVHLPAPYGVAVMSPFPCPFGVPCDRLYVRECYAYLDGSDEVIYRATSTDVQVGSHDPTRGTPRWKSSRFMPKRYARIWLEIVSVGCERLQDIAEDDARREGVEPWPFGPEQCLTSGERGAESPYRGGFAVKWDDLHAEEGCSWYSNPWVWRVEFRRLRP